MQDITVERGRLKINMKTFLIGEDLCVIISGGDTPHIGCVTLSVPRPSLASDTLTSPTTSALTLLGHKDDEPARYVSSFLSSKLNKNVVVTCGIHLDNITPEEIAISWELIDELIYTSFMLNTKTI